LAESPDLALMMGRFVVGSFYFQMRARLKKLACKTALIEDTRR
jgi:hypothetical protein